VDFFVQNLTGENCLVVSPVNLIHRTIHNSYISKAVATLVYHSGLRRMFGPLLAGMF